MTNSDENLLTVAKLREQMRGDLEGDPRLLDLSTLVEGDTLDALTFVGTAIEGWEQSELAEVVGKTGVSRSASEAVREDRYGLASHLVGVTETAFGGSSIEVALALLQELENDGAPAFVSAMGNPESGKTNTMLKLVAMLDRVVDDLLVVSNIRSWDRSDVHVGGMFDLMRAALEERDRPKVAIVDEASTHFDARTYRYEVATQWTPAAKRFAKVNIDVAGCICHTGKDYHPEAKRLTTLAFQKHDKTTVEWFRRWGGDDDEPSEPLFGGAVEDVEPYFGSYDPDDSAPWAWDLPIDLFQVDTSWDGLLDWLIERGPAEQRSAQ